MSEDQAPRVLDRVNFGRLDAEDDQKLLDYFVATGKAQAALDGARLVVGRKGSGKTAIFRYLSSELDGRVVELDLSEYVFPVHKRLVDEGVQPDFAHTSSWRLLIAIAMFGHVRSSAKGALKKEGDRLIEQLGMGPNGLSLRRIGAWLGRVNRVDLPNMGELGGLGGLELSPKPEPLVTETLSALDNLEALLAEHSKTEPITVLIDRLDDAWSGDDQDLALITGALRATRHFAQKFNQDGASPVVTFLRSDIWEKIDFNDKNKMSQDIIWLDWEDAEMLAVIAARVGATSGIPENQAWNRVFFTGEMRQRTSASTYILKRTLGRPRDIVAFSIFALEEARKSHHDFIGPDDIYAAEARYSKHALDELRDEIAFHVADFQKVVNALKRLRERSFDIETWQRAASAAGLTDDESTDALEQLFESSAVGIRVTGGKTGGSGTVFRYQDRHLSMGDNEKMQVHLALIKELRLTESRAPRTRV